MKKSIKAIWGWIKDNHPFSFHIKVTEPNKIRRNEMEIKLDWEQWKLLKELIKVAEMVEWKSTTGSAKLDDPRTEIDIHENITITLPD